MRTRMAATALSLLLLAACQADDGEEVDVDPVVDAEDDATTEEDLDVDDDEEEEDLDDAAEEPVADGDEQDPVEDPEPTSDDEATAPDEGAGDDSAEDDAADTTTSGGNCVQEGDVWTGTDPDGNQLITQSQESCEHATGGG